MCGATSNHENYTRFGGLWSTYNNDVGIAATNNDIGIAATNNDIVSAATSNDIGSK